MSAAIAATAADCFSVGSGERFAYLHSKTIFTIE